MKTKYLSSGKICRLLNDELQKLLNQIPENQHTLTQLRTKIELASTIKEEIEKRYLESEIIGAESDINPKQNRWN